MVLSIGSTSSPLFESSRFVNSISDAELPHVYFEVYRIHGGKPSNHEQADDVDSIRPSNEKHNCDEYQQSHHQCEKRAGRNEQPAPDAVAGVARVANPPSVPFDAHSAV